MKKKLTALLLTATVAICTAVTAFAAPSPSVAGVVGSIKSATDANGNALDLKLVDIASADLTPEQKAAVETIQTTEGLKEVLGSDFDENMKVADVKDVVAPEGTVFPATITFDVSGVTASSKGQMIHFDGTAWEKIATTCAAGTMSGTFNSLSPVAFVVDGTTAEAASTTSPKTGESAAPMAAALIAVLAMGGAFVVKRKMA